MAAGGTDVGVKSGDKQESLLTEQQVISHYKQLLGDCSAIRRKIAELEQESTEHELVMETLEKVEEKTNRRAFRLVGSVLVERTVADVLPSVQANHAGIKQVLGHLATDLRAKEEAAAAWKIKYSIRTQDELQAGAAAQRGSQQAMGLLA